MRRTLLSALCLILPLASCVKPAPDTALAASNRAAMPDGIADDAPPRILVVIAVILAAGLLASCTVFRPNTSWVELADDADAAPLSDAIVACVAEAAPQQGAVIELAALPEEQSGHLVALQIREKLTQRGYALAAPDKAGQHHLRYLVSRYGQDVLLRITLDGVEVSVLFAREAGGTLKASAPLALRQKGKAPS